MQLDVDDLREFYATPLGQTVRRLLTHRIRARWRGLQRSTLIGLGLCRRPTSAPSAARRSGSAR